MNKEKYNSDINSKNYYGHALDLKEDDERLKEYREQRNERGFDDSETWSLDCTIIEFILPRLKRLLEIDRSLKLNAPEYFSDLEKQIEIFENYKNGKININDYNISFLFKHFKSLWW